MLNKNLKIKKIFFVIFLQFIIYHLLFTIPSFAQTTLPLVVYPARQYLELSPGEKAAVTVNFVNQSDQPLSGFVRIVDFIVRDNQGSPELIEIQGAAPEKFSASSWFRTDYDRVTLPANEKVSIQAQISVPQNANPGGKYVAFYFQASPNISNPQAENEAQTAITPRLASLIYIKVKGDIKENAFVTKFDTKNFQEYGPINVETHILNRGDYHITPKGEIILTNMAGKVIEKSILKEQNIFPDTTRTYQNTLGKKWMIGKYQLQLLATYGEKGRTLTAYTEIWIFPWKLALIGLLSLAIFILIIRQFYASTLKKEKELEEELEREKEEIEELKKQLKNRE